jgi:multidrug efflux pump subunit AcrB
VREYPNIEEPVVSVRTAYPGASAEIIETQVTQVLEQSLAGIEGIETISSSSEREESCIEVPAGRIESIDREFTVLLQTGLTTPEQFERVIVKDASGFPVRLRDVARVEIGAVDKRRGPRYNGESAVTLAIVKQAMANPLEVGHAVRRVLPGIVTELPQGMNAEIAYDKSCSSTSPLKRSSRPSARR